jgi:hypothetical protein
MTIHDTTAPEDDLHRRLREINAEIAAQGASSEHVGLPTPATYSAAGTGWKPETGTPPSLGTLPPWVTPGPGKPNKSRKFKIFTISAGAIVALIVAAGLTSHSSGASTARSVPAAKAPASVQVASAAPAAPTPAELVTQWYSSGGKDQLAAVGKDTQALSVDAPAAVAAGLSGPSLAQLTADGNQLAADASAAAANPPPADAHGYYVSAMTDYQQSGTAISQGATDAANGDLAGAAGLITAANTAMQSGNTALQNATAALTPSIN